MEQSPLCHCANCKTIFVDPSIPFKNIPADIPKLHKAKGYDNDTVYECPVCATDMYLMVVEPFQFPYKLNNQNIVWENEEWVLTDTCVSNICKLENKINGWWEFPIRGMEGVISYYIPRMIPQDIKDICNQYVPTYDFVI